MRIVTVVPFVQRFTVLLASLFCLNSVFAQSNVTVRIMAANLNGNTQSIQPFEVAIFKGLKPDVVCIQEFNYSGNTAADFRALIDDAFGTNYSYYRESASGLQIPNGIISRYPIIASGRWVDTQVSNRGFAWARIDLPGSNDLYAVSVHLLTSGSGVRATEANNLKTLIQANFPANAWLVIGGDFNTTSRGESAITTLASLCPDSPIPTDAVSGGDYDSNANRNKPYDYVLASHSLTNYQTNVVFASHSFPKGLVFDSRVYTPLSDVYPVVLGDSGQGQHMAILKDFSIPVSGSNAPVAPIVSLQPQSQTIAVGVPVTFTVSANGTAPLSYQWRVNNTNILGAITNSYSIASAQTTNNGSYVVVITNSVGSVTSSAAILTVSNTPPVITTQPSSQSVYAGETAAFIVTAGGTAPLIYQWRFNGTNLSGATNDDYSFNNVQTNDAGNYTVVITNLSGSITSAVAVLTVDSPVPVILTNPTPLTVVQGAAASLNVVAGGATPLEYQWRFNGADIFGAITNPFTLSAAQLTDAGNYSIVITNFAGSVTSAVVALTVNPAGNPIFTGTLVGWDVNGVTNYGPSPLSPTTNASNLTVVGLTRGSGVTTTASSPAARAWGGDGFTATSAAAAVTANDFVTCGVTVNTGYTLAITLISKFDYRRSNSGSTNGVIQYRVGSGVFVDITNVIYLPGSGGASFGAIDLSGIGALQNIPAGTNVTFRIANYNGAAAGNWYIYDVAGNTAVDFAINGSITPIVLTPAAAPTIGTLAFTNNQIQFTISGTTGSNYIVQATTNLSPANWIPLRTNPAPFTFAETNFGTPQKFYRAVAQ
jgi:endonuclease/exonuclease/phosphatase family metal-dependent hydrolase